MGFCYLVQPHVLVGTSRFKVGMSKLSNLSRIHAYGLGTRILCIIDCGEQYLQIERSLINAFRDRYELIAGNEYYDIGPNESEANMIALFAETVRAGIEINQKSKGMNWMERFGHR